MYEFDTDHHVDRLWELELDRLEQEDHEWWLAYERVAERCDVTERDARPYAAGRMPKEHSALGSRSVTSQNRKAA